MKKTKTIFITGATSGVGYAIATKLVQQGHHVIATGRNKEKLQQLQQLNVETYNVDLQQLDQLKNLCEQLPAVDVAILNAGVGTFAEVEALTVMQVDTMIEMNMKAPFFLTQHLLPKMTPNSQFIFVGSQAGKVATAKASMYAATKHALIGFTNALRFEVKKRGIIVTVIHPGPIDTPFLQKADQTGAYKNSLGKFILTPEKVADKTIATLGKRVREINIPFYMKFTSTCYAIAPTLTEKLGKRFFELK